MVRLVLRPGLHAARRRDAPDGALRQAYHSRLPLIAGAWCCGERRHATVLSVEHADRRVVYVDRTWQCRVIARARRTAIRTWFSVEIEGTMIGNATCRPTRTSVDLAANGADRRLANLTNASPVPLP